MLNAYLKKYTVFAVWVGLEMVLFLGLPRVILFPLAAHILGKEQFGLFIFSLGIVMVVGHAPSVGLATGVIRSMAGLGDEDRQRLVAVSLFLCRVAMLVIVALGTCVVIGLWVSGLLDRGMALCLIPLFFFLGAWNLFDLQLVRCRVERRFDVRAKWFGFLSALLFLVIPAAIIGGAVGMSWAYGGAFCLAYAVLSLRKRVAVWPNPGDTVFRKTLTSIWLHVSVASALELSSRYVYRIMLGSFHSYADVSVFFGATNIIDLFLSPVTIIGSMLLSLLGGFVRLRDVGPRQKLLVLCAAVLICLVCVGLLMTGGRFVLQLLFPEFGDQSWTVLRGLILIVPCAVIVAFARPFVVKFGPVKLIPLLNLLVLVSHLLPGLILIPRLANKGAVLSCNIGYGLSAVLWLAALVFTMKSEEGSRSAIENELSCAADDIAENTIN